MCELGVQIGNSGSNQLITVREMVNVKEGCVSLIEPRMLICRAISRWRAKT